MAKKSNVSKKTAKPLSAASLKAWNESRRHAETVFNSRLNTAVLFFSVSVTGAVLAKTTELQIAVLFSGTTILSLLLLPLWRANDRLAFAMDYLKENAPNHPVNITARELPNRNALWNTFSSARPLIGFVLPLFLPVFMGVLLFLSIIGKISPLPNTGSMPPGFPN